MWIIQWDVFLKEKNIMPMLNLLSGTLSFLDLLLNWNVYSLLTQDLIQIIFELNGTLFSVLTLNIFQMLRKNVNIIFHQKT